ncbi:glycolate oxidase subunit GlcF [Marinivivus vitaminiproducens]|uniref:glycolate oxidase subunit GlcF n=1 Tax=Marinivivus vitaminiproducens TaxID=3035935 RepID=UPI0027A03E5E|nr:glycolate oxidase subunit GlcF [Geminicoccaceae bacterium SCSIO 64248]
MQTHFTEQQLADPQVRTSEKILRTCVHCGFCTATCPTYVLLGDELDSPRGRIYLIKQMLEEGRPADERTVKHLDRCLSCLSCMTTCPSGVDYMHLIDHAREHVHDTYRRPFADRALRQVLKLVLPRPWLFRTALIGAWFGRPFGRFLPARLGAMLRLAPASLPGPSPLDRPQVLPAEGVRRKRVALLNGCAQRVLDTEINESTIRLLRRHGCEVVIARGAGCCGALTHHMGDAKDSHGWARRNIDAWSRVMADGGLDAVVINTSGCGTTVKDYGHMLAQDPAYAGKAKTIAAMAKDVTELMAELGLQRPVRATAMRVAYHSACSMQHGQQIRAEPKALLKEAGFEVVEPGESHLCCGSAGTYNLLQPEIAGQLRDRKVANLERTRPDVIATGNIGCMTQIQGGTAVPLIHTATLLDWMTGGPCPRALHGTPHDRSSEPPAPPATPGPDNARELSAA